MDCPVDTLAWCSRSALVGCRGRPRWGARDRPRRIVCNGGWRRLGVVGLGPSVVGLGSDVAWVVEWALVVLYATRQVRRRRCALRWGRVGCTEVRFRFCNAGEVLDAWCTAEGSTDGRCPGPERKVVGARSCMRTVSAAPRTRLVAGGLLRCLTVDAWNVKTGWHPHRCNERRPDMVAPMTPQSTVS